DPTRSASPRSPRDQLTELRSSHDVVLSPDPTDLLGGLPRFIVLDRVGEGVSKTYKTHDIDIGYARIIELNIAVEAWNTQLRAGIRQSVAVEITQRLRLHVLASEADVVY